MKLVLYFYEENGIQILCSDPGSSISKKIKSVLLDLGFERDKVNRCYRVQDNSAKRKHIISRFQKKGVKIKFENLDGDDEHEPFTVDLYENSRSCWTANKPEKRSVIDRLKTLGFKWALEKRQYKYPGHVNDVQDKAAALGITFKVLKTPVKTKSTLQSTNSEQLGKIFSAVVDNALFDIRKDLKELLAGLKDLNHKLDSRDSEGCSVRQNQLVSNCDNKSKDCRIIDVGDGFKIVEDYPVVSDDYEEEDETNVEAVSNYSHKVH